MILARTFLVDYFYAFLPPLTTNEYKRSLSSLFLRYIWKLLLMTNDDGKMRKSQSSDKFQNYIKQTNVYVSRKNIFQFFFFDICFISIIIVNIVPGTKWEMRKYSYFLHFHLIHSACLLFTLSDATCLITYVELFLVEFGGLKKNHKMRAYSASPVFYYMNEQKNRSRCLMKTLKWKS